ncbi:MocR-like pyridoxine biosynthesis transcription factor PdxR [Embleya hyalina]|uniref:MocR-like pyridoxine biosynthesis transcription factor PdxR n=1 Tax=Embleya hyalina TaxID=516124 RepID=UPI001FE2882A|nr:PLP-dependent aminotransferase family protein [Embleya hyalina]
MRRAAGTGRSLEDALREAVRSGRLAAGTRLPGSRALASDLGLARGTIVRAYTQLAAEGWLIGSSGSGTRVAHVNVPESVDVDRRSERAPTEHRWRVDLRPGRPDLASFPRTAWATSVRRVLARAEAGVLDYGDFEGSATLRASVAAYAARARGVRVTPDAVVVTAGFSHGLALLARALRDSGVREAATEDPGLARHRELLTAAGLTCVPLPVDEFGADPADLTAETGVALLTPAHQHPSGVVLSPARRGEFVAWARRTEGFLIEDDYDGEFRYDGRPVGALQALDPERVVFAGSASKALAPGLRLGWLVVPPALRAPVSAAIRDSGAGVSVIEQLTLADLVARGDYDRHVRRVRAVYRRRRGELADRVRAVTGLVLGGAAAGLHALLPVPSAEHERRLVAAGAYVGLRLQGLHTSGYRHPPDPSAPAALVLGYATPPPHAWRQALDLLGDVLEAEGPRAGPTASRP